MDEYFGPGCGRILRSALQIYLVNGTLSEYFVSGQSNYAVLELKLVASYCISGVSVMTPSNNNNNTKKVILYVSQIKDRSDTLLSGCASSGMFSLTRFKLRVLGDIFCQNILHFDRAVAT